MSAPNYLLGKGELLTESRERPNQGKGKLDPYSLQEAQRELTPRARTVVKALDQLPDEACPNDVAVAAITLHHSYLSKSSFPSTLLEQTGLRAIGSRKTVVTPRKIVSTDETKTPQPTPTSEIFVAGPRESFRKLAKEIPEATILSPIAADLIKIEDYRAIAPEERVQLPRSKESQPLMELVLHTGGEETADYIRKAFQKYLKGLGIKIDIKERIDAGFLSFIAGHIPRKKVHEVAKFSFLRTVRDMPRLRQYRPTDPKGFTGEPFSCSLPRGGPIDPTIRVAVFDGGVPEFETLRNLVVSHEELDDLGDPVERFQRHGIGVTSALLYGPLPKGRMAPQPYARVHHYRVLDANTEHHPQDQLYPVLRRIASVLEQEKYDFVSLSIGPDIPLDDNEVHPWTAKLDQVLADGSTLASIAVGNSGTADDELKYNRIQPPSDCVNALSVGACDTDGPVWNKTKYSSVGHGRSPGFVKPDGVAFGGTDENPFWVIDLEDEAAAFAESGTSFAAPLALRAAIGIRAQLGPVISPLALKALLIHSCVRNSRSKKHGLNQVGWGKICTDVEELISCATSSANIVYQGHLKPRKVLRAQVPMPTKPIEGPVRISATICIATETDPQDPIHYTRSGLVASFRKDVNDIPDESQVAATDSFFGSIKGMSESQLRRDAYVWEPTLHREKTFQDGTQLKAPVLDIHFNPREGGHDATTPTNIPYAMVISVSAPDNPGLYDDILRKYKARLQPLQPRLRLTTRRT